MTYPTSPGRAPGPGAAPTTWPAPRRRSTTITAVELIVLVLGLLALAWILPQLVGGASGPGQVVVAVALAVVPFVGILLLLRWIDAWEPEPRGLLLVALAWGAGVATAVAATGNSLVHVALAPEVGDERASALTAVLSAPVTEEVMKGLGLIVIVLIGRGQLGGPVDGVVYSLAIGGGFAAVENIQYFLTYFDSVTAVFIQRGIMTPLVHPVFTVCTGLAVGIAVRSRRPGRWLVVLPGLLAAIALHALWNFTAVSGSFLQVFWSFQVPLFAALVALVLWLRRTERRSIATGLHEYAAAGWFARFEVDMLTSTRARRRAVGWAARTGRRSRDAMIDFQQAAVELALARRGARAGMPDDDHRAREAALLRRVVTDREVFTRARA